MTRLKVQSYTEVEKDTSYGSGSRNHILCAEASPKKPRIHFLKVRSYEEVPDDTLYSFGSRNDILHDGYITQDDSSSSFHQDVACSQTISVEEFMEYILFLKTSEWKERRELVEIAKDRTFLRHLFNYGWPIRLKKERCHNFSLLMNCILDMTRRKLNYKDVDSRRIYFCQNDPKFMRGSDARRKPDVLAVDESVLARLDHDSVDNMEGGGSGDGSAFHWAEAMLFAEHIVESTVDLNMEYKLRRSQPHPRGESPPGGSCGFVSSETEVETEGKWSKDGTSLQDGALNERGMSVEIARMTTPEVPQKISKEPVGFLEYYRKQTKRPREDDEDGRETKRMRREDMICELQCASYARNFLSNGGLRSHLIGLLVTDGQLELLYYDRSIHLRSEPFTFFDEDQRLTLIAVAYALDRFSDAQWGYESIISKASYLSADRMVPRPLMGEKPGEAFVGAEIVLDNGARLELGDRVFRQHALLGRGTCVIDAKTTKFPDILEGLERDGEDGNPASEIARWKGQLVVKLSYTAETCAPEGKMLEKLRKLAIEDKSGMEKHLPQLVWYQDVEEQEILKDVSVLLEKKGLGNQSQARVLRLAVGEKLFPITDFIAEGNVAGFQKAIREIFQCYRWVYEKGLVLHRDISVGNLMYRKNGKGTIYGVLNDFDFAACLAPGEHGDILKQRTGTQPYMAHTLLRNSPQKHDFWHDLESLFYCILDIVCEPENNPMKTWFSITGQSLGNTKLMFLLEQQTYHLERGFERIVDWLIPLKKLFRDVMLMQPDKETPLIEQYSEVISFEKFWCVITQDIA